MGKVTAENLAASINQLPKNVTYHYINPSNHGKIKVVGVTLPEGPVMIKRWNPSKGETEQTASETSISVEMLWRLANAFQEERPINVDRILGASYNTRSVLEALLSHTPEFYYCYPGRVSEIGNRSTVEHGHKHLLWVPDNPHENGRMVPIETEVVISEIPAKEVVYEAVMLPDSYDYGGMDLEVARRHTEIQIALYIIGLQLGYRTWIAQNDKGIKYKDRPLFEYDGIISRLSDERLVSAFDGAVDAALFIDCIWFQNGRMMPAVMEVEHTTGVTSGLSRMTNLHTKMPAIQTRYVIVAPDEDRDHVIEEANKPMFAPLNTWYFPYSSVEELFSIGQRRGLQGATDNFLDGFMEKAYRG